MPHSPDAAAWLDLAALLDPAEMLAPERERSEHEWLTIYRLASAHLVSPALYAALAARERLGWLPDDVHEALEALAQLNAVRNRRLRKVLMDTAAILNQAGLEPLLLKGANALLPDQYPRAFDRMLGDLDLAIVGGTPDEAAEALRAAQYFPAPRNAPACFTKPDDSHHHLKPMFHPSGAGYVELHRELLSRRRRAREALPLATVRARARPVDWEGTRVWIPAPEHRMLHNALHHQVQDQAFWSDRRSLRQLLEFAQLRALPEADDIDWPGLIDPLDRLGLGDTLRGYLLASELLFGQPLPAGVAPTAAAVWAERRFWWRLEHPRLRWIAELRWQVIYSARRLPNLPERLLTPAWYPLKYRSLRREWRERRVRKATITP